MRKSTREAIQRRLANDEEWAATQVGQTLQLLMDTMYVSIPAMCDILTNEERTVAIRTVQRWPNQPSLYPKLNKYWLDRLHADLEKFRDAVNEAIEAGEFEPDEDGNVLSRREEVVAVIRAYYNAKND